MRWTGTNWYSLELNPTAGLALASFHNGELRLLGNIPLAIMPGEEWILEGTAKGPNLSLKAWRATDQPPDEPQIQVVDDKLVSGSIGLFTNAFDKPGFFGARFDDVTWHATE